MQTLPTTLLLRPPAEASAYEATLTWESFVNGAYQQSTIQKQISLWAQPNASGFALEFCSNSPALTKPEDLAPMEQMALRLAVLYKRVLVQANPTGQVVALLNHPELLQTWAQLAQTIRETMAEGDQVTSTILAFMDQQLQDPANFLLSLQHDYLYQTLAPAFYNQPLSRAELPSRTRQFANFFDKVPLCFSEQIQVQPGEMPEQLIVLMHGVLDAERTDLTAVEQLIAKEFATTSPVGEPIPAVIPKPHFKYEAMYVVSQRTGLPISVTLSVFARAGLLYNKEYTLTLVPPRP